MNWHNLSNQDFDANIKGYMDKTSVPFDPASWNKMSQKLDALPPGSNSNGTGSYVLLMVVLLLATLFFWNVSSFPKTSLVSHTNSVDQAFDNSTQPDKSMSHLENESGKSEQDGPQNKISSNSTTPEKLTSPSESESSISVPNRHEDKISKDTHSNPIKTEAQPSLKIDENITRSSIVLSSENPQGTTIISSEANAANSKKVSSLVNNQSKQSKIQSRPSKNQSGQSMNFVRPLGPSINSSLQIVVPGSIEESVIRVTEQAPVIESTPSPWVLGFSYAPDLSMVGSSGVSNPGTNLFLSIEYKLNSRWSLQSGVAYSRKVYKAAGEDYNPPEGFWHYGMVPDATDATCDIIDIPINLRYYISPSKRNRFFASTGISSYLMLTEEYYYHYEEDYGPNLVEEWNVKNENQHFFSIYNLSIGYQRSLGAGWSLEVEPFVKVPLAGVGFAEVELWSTGAWFSVNYNFK